MFAGKWAGKLVLVGVTYYRRLDRTFLRREQFYGRVMSPDAVAGI